MENTEADDVGTVRRSAEPSLGPARPTSVQLEWRPDDGGNVAVVGRARKWLRQALPQLVGRRSRNDLHHDTELLLSELVTNAVLHAGGVTAVLLEVVGKTLRVTVCDRVMAGPVARAGAVDAEDGRGVLLIRRMASRWGVDRRGPAGGKCVWLELPTVNGALAAV